MATGESIQYTSRGKLIVLEGLDRSGKSSQAASLVQNLRQRGNDVTSLRFPGEFTCSNNSTNFLNFINYR